MNRAQALEAKTVADAALSNVTDANKVSGISLTRRGGKCKVYFFTLYNL